MNLILITREKPFLMSSDDPRSCLIRLFSWNVFVMLLILLLTRFSKLDNNQFKLKRDAQEQTKKRDDIVWKLQGDVANCFSDLLKYSFGAMEKMLLQKRKKNRNVLFVLGPIYYQRCCCHDYFLSACVESNPATKAAV